MVLSRSRGSPPSAQPPLSLLILVLASRAPGAVGVPVGAKGEATSCKVVASDRCGGDEVIVGPGYAGVLTRALVHPDHPNKQQRERIARSHSVDHPDAGLLPP